MADDFSGWTLKIANDGMSAVLFMEPESERAPYTVEETIEFIKRSGAVAGILYSEVEQAVELRQYYKDIVVARGRLPEDGQNGYYDFFFDQGIIKHPVIRSDGSVDYASMTMVHSVKSGDKLATYHPAIPGSHGYDVRGRELRCKPGKDLPEIHGSGFEMSFDGKTYVATMEGRVDYKEYKLSICDKYELKGDLDLVRGRIDFLGDVHVHGNVRSGTMIRSSKSITIDGSVEAATLIAEGDIVLKKGMQGGKRAKIVCGKDLYANFIEFTDVNVKGNLEANVVMNSKISVGGEIKISGKRGSIVGGSVYAVGNINTSNLGNPAEIKTEAAVGVTEEVDKRNHMLRVKSDIARQRIRTSEAEIEMLSDARINGESKEIKAAKRNQLKRHMERDKKLLEHINSELCEIENIVKTGRESVVNVLANAFPGCSVKIGNKGMDITSLQKATTFYRENEMSDVSMKNI